MQSALEEHERWMREALRAAQEAGTRDEVELARRLAMPVFERFDQFDEWINGATSADVRARPAAVRKGPA